MLCTRLVDNTNRIEYTASNRLKFNPMDSAVSVTTTAQMVLFRALHRHLSRAPHRSLLRRKLKCAVTSYNNRFRIPCSSTSVPLSPSLYTFHALLSRTPCRTRCLSSSAASFASSGGSGNGGAGAGNGGGGGGSGGEFGDASIKLIGDTAQELSTLSPDAIILDVSVWIHHSEFFLPLFFL